MTDFLLISIFPSNYSHFISLLLYIFHENICNFLKKHKNDPIFFITNIFQIKFQNEIIQEEIYNNERNVNRSKILLLLNV